MEAAKIQELDLPTPDVQEVDSSTPEAAAPAVRSILGPNLFVGFDLGDLAASIADFAAGLVDARSKALEQLPKLGMELFSILAGRSEIEPDPSDKRFTDPAWKENPFYRSLMQGYLAWRGTMLDIVNEQTTNGSD